jgi:hypothetical protein
MPGREIIMRMPLKIRFSVKCKRCGLRYPENETACPHCDGLSEDQLRRIRIRHRDALAGNAGLGRLLLYIAGLVIVVMVIYALNNR